MFPLCCKLFSSKRTFPFREPVSAPRNTEPFFFRGRDTMTNTPSFSLFIISQIVEGTIHTPMSFLHFFPWIGIFLRGTCLYFPAFLKLWMATRLSYSQCEGCMEVSRNHAWQSTEGASVFCFIPFSTLLPVMCIQPSCSIRILSKRRVKCKEGKGDTW